MKINRQCIVCECRLGSGHAFNDSPDDDSISNGPSGGIYLESRGNFGSTVFDTFGTPTILECYLCDACLRSKGHLINLYDRIQQAPVCSNVRTMNPPKTMAE